MGTYFGDNKVKIYLGDKLISGDSEELNPFPVGAIYMSIDSTDPSVYYGGTWIRIAEGRTLIGVGTGIDEENISKTITAEEKGGSYAMQQHLHKIYTTETETFSTQSGGYTSSRSSYNISQVGTGTSENIQPYYGIYIWKRIS